MCNNRNDVMSLWTTDHPVFVCVYVRGLLVCVSVFVFNPNEIALAKASV